MPLTPLLSAPLSGALVGLSLGLVGGGGSLLAVPLLVYVVGVADVHVAIGTSALAVSASALASLAGHWRRGHVKWPCAAAYAAAGMAGAALGSMLGKSIAGSHLMRWFPVLVLAAGLAMLRPQAAAGDPRVRITPAIAVRLVALGLATGFVSGLFGIGGGFLAVPGIALGSGMPVLNAVGSSLLPVSLFGLTTAASYAASGLVDWPIAGAFIAGGVAGGAAGIAFAARLARRRGVLARAFALTLLAVGSWLAWHAWTSPHWTQQQQRPAVGRQPLRE